LARSTLAQVTQDEANRARAGGTTSEPNAFGQQMLVLVPFGLWAMLYARTLPARILGGFGGLACLAGAGLSFSRGSYLAIVVMFVLMLLHLRLNLRYLLILPLMYIALSAAPAELRARFGSLNSLLPNSQEQNIESDASIRRRSVEMWMAFYMFADHPVAGVGADNFVPLYPTYIRQFGSNVDDELRNAHSYYLEIAAEHGLVGIVVIGGIFVTTITALREARKRFKQVGNTNMAELMVAMQIAFIGYAVSATFLHGDYTRFLWLQVDLAAAASLIAAHAWRRSLATAQQKVEGLPSGAAAVA
jgi:O-antigen ligase